MYRISSSSMHLYIYIPTHTTNRVDCSGWELGRRMFHFRPLHPLLDCMTTRNVCSHQKFRIIPARRRDVLLRKGTATPFYIYVMYTALLRSVSYSSDLECKK